MEDAMNREAELEILRQAIDDVSAGRGMPFEEFMAQLAEEYKLPTVEPEEGGTWRVR